MSTVLTAYLLHGWKDGDENQPYWKLSVQEVSVWRLVVSRALEEALYPVERVPWLGSGVLIYRLVNWACQIDNSFKHRRAELDVTDDWVKQHFPELWEED